MGPRASSLGALIHDHNAERAVVGVVLNTRHGLGHLSLTPAGFYVPRHASLYAAAEAMPDVVGLEERIKFAAAFSDAPEGELRRMVSESPVMFDASPWARRVAGCAQRRAAMHQCVAAYEALRDGADVGEAMAWST